MIFHIKCRKYCNLLLNKSVIINRKFILVSTMPFFNSVEVQFRDYLRSGIHFAVRAVYYCQYWEGFPISPSLSHFLKTSFRTASSLFWDNSEREPSITWRDWSEEEKVETGGRPLFFIAPGFHPLSSRFTYVHCVDTENPW